METLIYVIIASLTISLISLVGASLFVIKENKLKKYMILFVALAAGALLGTAFLHLIPESFEILFETGSEIHLASYFILFGILLFYIIEKFIHWHHHHDLDCHHHSLSTLSLVGDGFHNFLDGIVIGVAFVADIRLGIVTTVAIALHEIPQEIGDLSILLHSGFSKAKALLWNFISGLFSVIGALIAYFYLSIESILPMILALTAGMFIYISLADIIPELHKKQQIGKFGISLVFLLGILISFLMSTLAH